MMIIIFLLHFLFLIFKILIFFSPVLVVLLFTIHLSHSFLLLPTHTSFFFTFLLSILFPTNQPRNICKKRKTCRITKKYHTAKSYVNRRIISFPFTILSSIHIFLLCPIPFFFLSHFMR